MFYAFIFWLIDDVFAFLNYSILYLNFFEPSLGVLPAHRIAMTIRIIIIITLSFILLNKVPNYTVQDLFQVGLFWLSLSLFQEWFGSFYLGRSVDEILIGWNILGGYLWVLILCFYLLGPYIVGIHINQVYLNKKPLSE